MLQPTLPPYDIGEWRKQPFGEKLRWVCMAWAMQGYGSPLPVYTFYVLKIALYVYGWAFFCTFSPGTGSLLALSSWSPSWVLLQKAIIWSMAFEALGLGCGSGPLTGRYMPPVGGFLSFLRPGTTKLPFFPKLPILGGHRRTWLDVLLYAAHIFFLFRALLAPEVTFWHILPTILLLPLLGLADKTIFLISRGEHYYTAMFCMLFVGESVAALKLVWVGVWMWAATSKINHHFPSVICVMLSNSPFTNFSWLRKKLYRQYPDDLRPSSLAVWMAHMGTVVEFGFPLVLLFAPTPEVAFVALVVMLCFHIFITSHVPMGVPIEWNIMMVFGGFVLFGHFHTVSLTALHSPLLIGLLALMLFVIPLYGNFFPAQVSFLCSMRYYAGNWPFSIWLFRGESSKKLDQHLTKMAPRVQDQLRILYDEDTITALISKVMAFRAMHLQGRAIQMLVPQAVDDVDAYEYLDGELVAGVVLGWNFGDGHLHQMQLLEAVQSQCHFEEGELRCVFVESQSMGGKTFPWVIADAATGELQRGEIEVSEMRKMQPWPTSASATSSSSS